MSIRHNSFDIDNGFWHVDRVVYNGCLLLWHVHRVIDNGSGLFWQCNIDNGRGYVDYRLRRGLVIQPVCNSLRLQFVGVTHFANCIGYIGHG